MNSRILYMLRRLHMKWKTWSMMSEDYDIRRDYLESSFEYYDLNSVLF